MAKKKEEQTKEESKEEKKEKGKGKKGKKDADKASASSSKKGGKGEKINDKAIDRNKVSASEMTQAQIEEAIKESQDPSTKLKKLRSPLSVRNCLLNLLILVVVTIALVILICYFMLDHETFNLVVVVKDILDKFHITSFFQKIFDWFKKIFS